MAKSTDTQETTEKQAEQAARTLALQVADILTNTPAANTLLLEIREFSTVADFFLLCSGDNERQLRAISEEINEELAKEGIRPLRTEGTPQSGWIVLDYGEVVAHIFSSELREFYRLEQLWAEAPRVLSIQ